MSVKHFGQTVMSDVTVLIHICRICNSSRKLAVQAIDGFFSQLLSSRAQSVPVIIVLIQAALCTVPISSISLFNATVVIAARNIKKLGNIILYLNLVDCLCPF